MPPTSSCRPASGGRCRRRAPGRDAGHQPGGPTHRPPGPGWPGGSTCPCRCATPADWRPRCGPVSRSSRTPSVIDPAPGPVVASRPAAVGPLRQRCLALDDVDLDLPPGRSTAVMGETAPGKSTLLRHLVGLRRPGAGIGDRGRPAARRQLRPPRPSASSALVPQDPASLLSCARRWPASAGEADHDAELPPGPPGRSWSGSCPAWTTSRIPATCPKGSVWRWPWPSCSPRRRRSCSSTSPPAASTTRPRPGSTPSCGAWPPTGTAWSSPPTTSSWWPRPPTGSSCSPTGSSSATARPARSLSLAGPGAPGGPDPGAGRVAHGGRSGTAALA